MARTAIFFMEVYLKETYRVTGDSELTTWFYRCRQQ
jgi:hypothetical protein